MDGLLRREGLQAVAGPTASSRRASALRSAASTPSAFADSTRTSASRSSLFSARDAWCCVAASALASRAASSSARLSACSSSRALAASASAFSSLIACTSRCFSLLLLASARSNACRASPTVDCSRPMDDRSVVSCFSILTCSLDGGTSASFAAVA